MPEPTERAVSLVQSGQIIDKGIYLYHLADEVLNAFSPTDGSDRITCALTSSETLSAWTCVRSDATGLLTRCLSDSEANQDQAIGVLMHAVVSGAPGLVLQQGVVTDSAFSRFAVGDLLFIAADATLTSEPVSIGFLQMVGRVIAEHTLSIDFSQAILRML